MPNVIRVEFDASDEAQASAKISSLNNSLKNVGAESEKASQQVSRVLDETTRKAEQAATASTKVAASVQSVAKGAPARDIWDDLIAGTARAEQKANDLENALEDSFVKSKASASSVTDTFVRGLTQAQRQALSLQQAGKSLGADGARLSAESAQLQTRFSQLYRQLATGRPLSELNKELDEARLKLERLNQQAITLRSHQIARSAETGTSGQRIPGLASAASFAGSQLGLPGLGTLTSSLNIGGAAAGVGISIAAFAGIREIIRLNSEAEQSQINLTVAARDTGRTFSQSQATAESFRREMVANREESVKLAAAFGELQLRSGEAVKPGDTARLSTLANARGLSPEDAAKAVQGLARGSKEAFEELTGLRGDLVLDRYARSIGTTADKLADMERVQALSNAAFREANSLTDIAAQRMNSLDSRWQSFKNTLGEVAAFVPKAGGAFLDQFVFAVSGGQFGAGPEDTYRRAIAEAREGDANASYLREFQLAQKRRAEETERKRQHTLARELEERLSEQQRQERALPESYQSEFRPQVGQAQDLTLQRTQTEARAAQNLARLRAQRQAAEAEYEAFQKIQSQFKDVDAKKFDEQFRDRIQGLTDQIRTSLDSAASDAQAKAKQLADAVLTARDALRSFLSDAAIQADRDNPFISLFIRLHKEVEDTRKQFLVYGKDFAAMMAGIKRESIEGEIAVARFASGISALKSLQEARRLSQPFVGLTGPQERRRDVIGAEISNLTEGEEYRRRALALENPFTARNAGRELNDTFRRLQALDVSGAGRAGREAQADAILNLLKDIDPRTLTGTARGALIDANRTKATGFEESVRDAIARERTGNLIQTDARELLKSIQASGLGDGAKLKEFLAVTGTLSDKELVADLRRGRESALRESARIESAKDRDGERRGKKLEDFLDRVDRAIAGKGIKVDAGPAAQINITSKDVTASTASRAPAMLPGS
jgi:hypothetical protein